jgi:hypothetical protein
MERHKTDTNLQETIVNCIDSTLSDRDINRTGPFTETLEAQYQIGWEEMLRGYWSTQWQREYEQTYLPPQEEDRTAKNKRTLQMQRWQKQLIQTVWHSMIALWKLRNDERHGWDAESREAARREVMHHELAEIYDRKDDYPARVQRLLRPSYETHIQETATKIADWLDAYKGTFAVTWSPD